MNCPYCNKKMELGYIDETDLFHRLEWYPANRDSGFFKSNKRNVRLSYDGCIKAYRCESCKKIIIDEDMLQA